jgi:hypothetical protein
MTKEITITKLPSPLRVSDWHDRPARWQVIGPKEERQLFATRKHAQRYASIRRKSRSLLEASHLYVLDQNY